jgi:Zn-dependent peptidase ImmA (M78 family)/transcriptional regulator with XRE-family HTH domain
MRSGSPGFVGQRLREAREARQMTAIVLAELSGITSSAISSYEKGHTTPSPGVFDRLCSSLNFKPAFFFRPMEDANWNMDRTVFERSRAATTKMARMRARHRLTWLYETLQYLGQFARLPDADIPMIDHRGGWRSMSDEAIEETAKATRRHWRLGDGPISNMTLLAENHGVVVANMEMGTPKLDAFSTWDDAGDRPYMVLGTDGQSAFRSRFNVAHELGHLILHRNVIASEFDSMTHFKEIEEQADRFASAFLTPASAFSSDLTKPTLEVFRILKPKWRASVKMMIHRAQDINIIDKDEARRLYISYNRRGWNAVEPFDEDEPLEEPRLVRRVFEALEANDVIERSQLAAALPFNPEDIEQLANLPTGYLTERSEQPDVWQFIEELTSEFPG